MRRTLITPDLALIPAGSFAMGNDRGRDDERPAHRVHLALFRAGLTPVTNAEYASFLEATDHEAPPWFADPRFNNHALPVVGVSWFDAVAFCRWLSEATADSFRLPTEAEREYAALGGRELVDWPWGNERPKQRTALASIAALSLPHAPDTACINGYGLLCTADNVHEWCSDWYDPAYYAVSPSDKPAGPDSGKRRASRGGSWRHQVKFTRVSARSSLNPSYRYNDYGFRVYADA